MSEPTPPDFAMARAVEILANIYERNRKEQNVPPPPCDVPIVLFNETVSLQVGVTTRKDVEKAFGIAYSYPAAGWHTYCVRGTRGEKLFVSIFYADGTMAAAELYLPKVERAPKLAPRDLFFRLVPSEITVGLPFTSLPEHFGRIEGLPPGLGAYADVFEARFPGGAAYAMCNEGIIERIAVYVHDSETLPEKH